MKILLLSGANVIHTTRLANGLVEHGVEVHLVSIHELNHSLDKRVSFYKLACPSPLGYFLDSYEFRKLIKNIQPDLINAHYASGYGTLARHSGFCPLLISAWGSDVYDFPERSFMHASILRKNFQAATAIASTSMAMAKRIERFNTNKRIYITPFGIDEELFKPMVKKFDNQFVIGTVKTLKRKYGIDTLIRAFSIVVNKLGSKLNLKLEITGTGPDLQQLKELCLELQVEHHVTFHGFKPHEKIPEMLNRLDIYVALSRLDSESFGVAILEASACAKPVVVSDADGPSEVTIDGYTGFIVPREDYRIAAAKICELIENRDLRKHMGDNGRRHVIQQYNWKKTVDNIVNVYSEVVAGKV